MENKELSYYELYLLKYLLVYHPDKATDNEFIRMRANSAADIFEHFRRQGCTVESAQELAMKELMKGLHFSKYQMICEILSKEFEDEISYDKVPELAKKILVQAEDIFSHFEISDEFEQTSDYEACYSELTGNIVLYLEKYGI